MVNTSLILGVDTSLGATGLVLVRGGECLAAHQELTTGKQAAQLLPWIETLLAKTGLAYEDLHGFAVTTGPGGFTSIRVGLAAVRALALATRKPALGFSTLEVMAADAQEMLEPGTVFFCAIPGGREQYFIQRFTAADPRAIAEEAPFIIHE